MLIRLASIGAGHKSNIDINSSYKQWANQIKILVIHLNHVLRQSALQCIAVKIKLRPQPHYRFQQLVTA